ncbi:MAG: DUF5916 domain-containing protein, partial [Longimicrobiales bacterium]|nr:DUF5916 domain-containing protein [Longimicrobiales bacterium]
MKDRSVRSAPAALLRSILCLLLLSFLAPASLAGQEGQGEGEQDQPPRPAARADTTPGAAPADTGGVAGSGLPTLRAVPRTGEIEVDGRFSEAAWEEAPVATGFIQREPVEGQPAEDDTEVRVLYDDEAIYVAARMFDDNPASIADQLVRRDQFGQFDYVAVGFDPNLDRRTGYEFRLSAAGVQGDSYFYNDDQNDRAWDAVWESGVTRDSLGWTAEFRIPLSQIRYEPSDTARAWGFNVRRRRLASNEETHFALVSRLQQGVVSQFGRLDGVRIPEASRRLEMLPYVLSQGHVGPAEEGDPFFDGTSGTVRLGTDFKVGIGGNFTLDGTINPDFGQVEADPAVINLSAFETFFDERRPFFVEDARIFDFTLSGRQNRLFYSRRIGREPQGDVPADADFTDVPTNTTILGAAKVSGRTEGGLSVGALAA